MPELLTPRPGLRRPAVFATGTSLRKRLLGLILPLFGIIYALLSFRVPMPPSLDSYLLVGPRGPACLEVVVGVDLSGSMTDYAVPRDLALINLFAWMGLPDTLRESDRVAVVDFAGEAAIRLPSAPVRSGPALPSPTTPDGGTDLAPLLDVVSEVAASDCDVAVVLISDGDFGDLPTSAQEAEVALREHNVHDLRLLVPGESVTVPAGWPALFPESIPVVFDGMDPNETARAMGYALADLTGQQLIPRE